MTDLDDLVNDINSVSTKKKGKGKKKEVKEEIPLETVKEEVKVEVKEEKLDDLINDIENTKTDKKKKKRGGKKNETNEETKEKETVETVQAEPEKKKEEEKIVEKEKDEGSDNEDENENKDKKKKKTKKKGKAGKNDLLLQIALEKKKKEREIQERLEKELEIKRKKEEEEEELRRKEEEAKKKLEEDKRKEEEKKMAELELYKLSKKELELLEKKQKTFLDNLNQQGIKDIDEFMDNLKLEAGGKKKGKKKKTGKNEGPTEKVEETVNVAVEQKEVVHYEEEKKKEINTDVVDDWEDFGADDATATVKTEVEVKQNTVEVKKDTPIETKKEKAEKKVEKAEIDNTKYRAPIICILGHVDTGKTTLLDKLRKTNVQEGEAGGITQQIGATYFPIENFKHHLEKIPEKFRLKLLKLPGLEIIDTPGHESFTNLRNRGASLCDLAILVVDMMHGVQNQTLESLNLLKSKKCPFIIALNKIDRIYQWKPTEWGAYKTSLNKQKSIQKKEFNDRLNQNTIDLIKKGSLNVALYDENEDIQDYINIVPTSGHSGEGLPDLLGLLLYLSQNFFLKQLEFKEEVQCIILEVKVLDSLGATVDVILVNGTLKLGDHIILGGLYGAIRSQIKCLLTPHPMKEIRVKNDFMNHDSISGTMGLKIFGPGLENALAGAPLFIYKNDEEAKKYEEEIFTDSDSVLTQYLSTSGKGILVQSSTLGSLEAMLIYLQEKGVEVCAVGIGPLHKRDIVKIHTIHNNNDKGLKEHLTVLAFDIKVLDEASKYAETVGVKIFTADVIYHLFDKYIEYEKNCVIERKKEKEKLAVFPFEVKIIPNAIFNKKDPIILGVEIVGGILKVGSPIYCVEKKLLLGIVEGIEHNKKPINNVRSGSYAIRIKPHDTSIAFGRHFDEKDTLVSKISRQSIDSLKEFFKDDMDQEDWELVIKLKGVFDIY